jgi:2-(1,2-epoxy-1,2-dihydrophenyl)acetyl-CoA isomerase
MSVTKPAEEPAGDQPAPSADSSLHPAPGPSPARVRDGSGAPEQYETVALAVRDGVAHLLLDRPEQANSINLALARDLRDATLAIADDPRVRAVLLTAAGPRFCGGGDLKEFVDHPDDLGAHLRSVLEALNPAVDRLVRGDAPVVAAVQGSVAGGGIGLMCAADLVIAGESTKFVLAHTGVGATPDGSASWFLPRLVGLRRALELTLTNRPLTAAEALDWGLITSVVPDDALQDEAAGLAARLAAGPRHAYDAAKRLMHESLAAGFEAQLAREAEEIARAGSTHDAVEGMRAFVEKRAPQFRGD